MTLEIFSKTVPNINVTGEGISAPFQFTQEESAFLMMVDEKSSFGEIAKKMGLSIDILKRIADPLISKKFILVPVSDAEKQPHKNAETEHVTPQKAIPKPAEKPSDRPGQIPPQTPPLSRDDAEPIEIHRPRKDQVTHGVAAQKETPSAPVSESGSWNMDLFFKRLNQIYKHQHTGLWVLKNQKHEAKQLYFNGGNLVAVLSEPFNLEERIGQILIKDGKVTEPVINEIVETTKQSRRVLGEELLIKGSVSRNALQKGLMTQMEMRISPIFQWASGTYEWSVLPGLPSHILGINIPLSTILFNAVWKYYPEIRIRSDLLKYQNAWVTLNSKAAYDPNYLRFGQMFQGFWSILSDKELPLTKVMLLSNMNKRNTEKMVWLLYRMELITFEGHSQEEKAKAQLEELENRVKSNARGSYFDALNVHWTVNNEAIRQAYEKSKQEVQKYLERAREIEKFWLDQLNKQIETAYENVKEYPQRQAYRARLFSDETYIQRCAELFQEKTESLMFTKEDFEQAVIEAQNALEIVPDNTEAIALLGLSKFVVGYGNNRAMAEEGRRKLHEAYRKMPKSIVVNICMGMMYRREHKYKEAITYYNKILELQPKNRFARMEIREIQSGKRDKEREQIAGEFVNRQR